METTIINEATQTNATIKSIYERRAIRKYKTKPVERKIIDQILAAGKMAPSAINKQPWKFYILTNRENIRAFSKEIVKVAAVKFIKTGIKNIVKKMADAIHLSHGVNFFKGEDPIFHGAPVVIFITSPKDNEWATLDIGMCAQNMMLAAKSFGLDSCPVGLGKFVEQTNLYSKLNVPDSEQVTLSIILGYGDEKPEVHERKKNDVVFID